MQPGNPPDEEADRASSSSRVVPAKWQRLTVLVVEDHPAYRILLGWILHKLALEFVMVDDGQAGLAVMERQPIDLVLTDCEMPVMDGYAMTRQVRRNERLTGTGRVPIIAFTATLGPEQIQRCVVAGMDAWLLKPVTLEKLRDVLTDWLPLSVRLYRPAAAPHWPTRASLLETFGSVTTVEQLLQTLVGEARVDLAVLTEARRTRDACATAQHLHRLIGSVAFLGADSLETRGARMIDAVAREGVARHARSLGVLLKDIHSYVRYLSSL
ncbi:response regulator [Pseudomonas sp. NS1(2017)]|uniref:response regulator n=1 Tax=Pseudomonas sp. NS1(2017) TaxID=2025658 RepID=UPI000BA23701|nr:response regulator [Pseudomonas sp. NS1(2017)]ASV36865.1 response regulator [Pseudomonas sp. NS1(2017)]